MGKKRNRPAILAIRSYVLVNGLKFEGFVAPIRCPECTRITIYSDEFYGYFCAVCDSWLDNDCEDPHCSYCLARPDNPMSAGVQADVRQEKLMLKRDKRIIRNQRKYHWLKFKGKRDK